MSSIQSAESAAECVAASASFESLPEEVDKLVVAYAPRDTFRRSRSEGRLGETTWELLSAWNHPGAKFLETLTKHPTARWSFCA